MEIKIPVFQKAGGIAALIEALTYIAGFTIFVVFLDFPDSVDPVESLAFMIDKKGLIIAAMSLIYVFASLVLLVLVLALNDRLKADAPALMQVATATGIIWTGVVAASGMIFITGAESVARLYVTDPERAATVWLAVGLVQDGLGGGIELLGGVWIFTLSAVALRSDRLSKPLNVFGLFIGLAGILTVFPGLSMLVDVFGLSQIVWFIWIGIFMLTSAR